MGNKFGCDFCIRSRGNKAYEDMESFDKDDPILNKIDKFMKINGKFIISKSREKLIYYSFITSSMYILFSHSFYLALTSESIYVLDEYMMNVIKRIPLQYIISIMKCERSGNIGILHYAQTFKTPVMLLNVKDSKEVLEIPKSYTEEILDKISFFKENSSSDSLNIVATPSFKEEVQKILNGNKESYLLYKEIKSDFKFKIEEKLSMKKAKLIRVYFVNSNLNPKKENPEDQELTFLVLLPEQIIIFEGREAFLDISENLPYSEITSLACNEYTNKFIIRNEKVNREIESLYTAEIILAIKAFAPETSMRILSTREYTEYLKSVQSRVASSNISKVQDESERKEAQQTDLKGDKLLTTFESENKGVQKFSDHDHSDSLPFISRRNPIELIRVENEGNVEMTIKFPCNVNFESPLSTPFSIKHEDSIIDGEDMTTDNLLKLTAIRLWKLFRNYND